MLPVHGNNSGYPVYGLAFHDISQLTGKNSFINSISLHPTIDTLDITHTHTQIHNLTHEIFRGDIQAPLLAQKADTDLRCHKNRGTNSEPCVSPSLGGFQSFPSVLLKRSETSEFERNHNEIIHKQIL